MLSTCVGDAELLVGQDATSYAGGVCQRQLGFRVTTSWDNNELGFRVTTSSVPSQAPSYVYPDHVEVSDDEDEDEDESADDWVGGAPSTDGAPAGAAASSAAKKEQLNKMNPPPNAPPSKRGAAQRGGGAAASASAANGGDLLKNAASPPPAAGAGKNVKKSLVLGKDDYNKIDDTKLTLNPKIRPALKLRQLVGCCDQVLTTTVVVVHHIKKHTGKYILPPRKTKTPWRASTRSSRSGSAS